MYLFNQHINYLKERLVAFLSLLNQSTSHLGFLEMHDKLHM